MELRRAFNISPPERYKNAVSFLRMLFESSAKNTQKMEGILKKHEDRYAFNNRTTYFDHSYIGIWELKSYAYDYYFFFKENSIPLDYFLEPKEYLSYYLRAILCSYSPENRAADIWKIVTHKEIRNYPIGEVDLDMFVKFVSPKSLKSWLEKYSVQHLVVEDGFEVTQKFINLCASFAHFKIQYWAEMIHIDDEGLLYQRPFIESSPAYVTVQNGIETASLEDWMKEYFLQLAKAGIGVFPSPFAHQISALEAAARG
ncbi:hypothetical protein B5E65_02090 [Gemmiger sp. An120]|nr:hypothetical protein B5E65_02090 [Gemmiger sp. An120]